MKVSVVKVSDILAEPGAPLVSGYWTDRGDGETYAQWQLRKGIEEIDRRASVHEAQAARLRAMAAEMREKGSGS